MTRGSWLSCAYRSHEDWHAADFCCPLKHITSLCAVSIKEWWEGSRANLKISKNFSQARHQPLCLYVIILCTRVCVLCMRVCRLRGCTFVSRCLCHTPGWKAVGVCVFCTSACCEHVVVFWGVSACVRACMRACVHHREFVCSHKATKFSATRPQICRRPLRT